MKGPVCVVACLLLSGYVVGLNVGENCLTPDGESGRCIRIGECSEYSSLLIVNPPPPAVISLLKKAKCGVFEKKPLLCCPGGGTPSKQSEVGLENRCQTPSGANGKCVAKNECSLFSTSAQSPVASQLLQQSRCGRERSGEMYCCPSQGFLANNNNHKNVGLLDINTCGPVSNINILHANGSKSEQYGFPWVALIAYSGETGPASYRCTGSLISKRYVLTAAHCLKYLRGNAKPLSVRLGELNLATSIDCTEDECVPLPQDVNIESVFVHPDYKGWPNYEHDIALLKLARDVNLNTPYVKPVCLPIGMSHETKYLVGEKLFVSGWCSYENKEIPVLLEKKLKGLSNEECALMLKKEVPISSDNQLCTTSEKNSNCEGYGGSPLVKYENGPQRTVAIQYGIASFGPKHCSHSGIPSVFTRLSQYSRWILDTIV